MRGSRSLLLVLPLLAVAGVSDADSDAEAAARLRAEITRLVGDAPCSNVVNCRVIGLGARPCGGPEEYVAYSTWTQRDAIEGKGLEYSFLREELLTQREQAGACVVLPEPQVACVNRRCVTVPVQ
jgi:hypothetical protein